MTALDLISASLTMIGQLGRGQTTAPEDGAIGLQQSNLILEQASTQRLFLSYVGTREYQLSAGDPDYTIGPSGADFVAPRPVLIESAQVNVGNTGYWAPISVWNKMKWDAIRNKGASADVPDGIYVEYTFPNVSFHVNPVTNANPHIRIGAWEMLQQFNTLFDVIAMPPAYTSWLQGELAIVLAPFYDQPITPSLIDFREKAIAKLNSYNAQSLGSALSAADQFESANIGQPIIPGAPTSQQQ